MALLRIEASREKPGQDKRAFRLEIGAGVILLLALIIKALVV
jgi:hypothetical protein